MDRDHISFTEYTYLMCRIAYWLINNNKKFNTRNVYGYMDRSADYGTIIRVIKERGTNYQPDSLIAEFVECAIYDNTDLSFLPNYVVGRNGTKYFKQTYVNMAQRVSAYEVLNGVSPAIVYLKKEELTSNNKSSILNEAKKIFGDFNTCDGWLGKIQGRGYSFYYNNKYSNRNTLQRIKNKQGANCTDSTELSYQILVGLGYTVQVIHVMCKSGTGHVRLRCKHPKYTDNQWIYRDPAAVLKGNGIRSNWCANGRVVAYDPKWIMDTINW